MGVYGEIIHLLSDQIQISPRVRLKRSNDRGEFNTAINSFALASETHSSDLII